MFQVKEAARAKAAFDGAKKLGSKLGSKLVRPGKNDDTSAKKSDDGWTHLWPIDKAEDILKDWKLDMGRSEYTGHLCLGYVTN